MYNYLFTLLILIIPLVSGCDKKNEVSPLRSWYLIRIESERLGDDGSTYIQILKKPSDVEGKIVINFNDDIIGKYNGHTLSNTFLGSFKSVGGNNLESSFSLITRVSETPWGNEFVSRMNKIRSYSISENQLELYIDNGKLIFQPYEKE